MNEYIKNSIRPFFSENRFETIIKVISKRTKYIIPVLEDLYDPHNIGAVLRSCESMGIFDIHIIENENQFKTTSVDRGSKKWLNINKNKAIKEDYKENTINTIKNLKEKGYKIIATFLDKNSKKLNDFKLDQASAIVFGNEKRGISNSVIKEADELLYLPMNGFVESLNISVCAALTLKHFALQLKEEHYLNEEEQIALLLKYTKEHIGIEKYDILKNYKKLK